LRVRAFHPQRANLYCLITSVAVSPKLIFDTEQKMRVAHILRKYNPAEWGGTETAVKQVADGLAQQEVRSVFYCPRLESTPARDPIAEGGHEIKRYRSLVPVWNISPEQRLQLISIGGNLLSFDLFGKLLRERPLDVVHTHTLNRLGGIALTAARLRKVPFVVTIHGGVLDLPKSVAHTLSAPLEGGYEWGKLFGAFFRSRKVMAEADAIVTCNPREAELAREKYPGKKVLVQPHGVSIAKYASDQRELAYTAYPQLRGGKILLTIGRVDPVKNQGWLLVQLPQILQRFPEAQMVFAGACTDELYGKALRKEVRKLGLENKVLFTGGLSPNDPVLVGLTQLADVVVVPSVSETFGLVILESWAARRPVVSSRTSGARSIVRHQENGLLFDLEKPEQLHESISALLSSPALARQIGEAGHQLAASEFDMLLLTRHIKSLYAQLIADKRK
jgi:alpha-maltose-1-phosphate synthase